jgi:hypothetical protein
MSQKENIKQYLLTGKTLTPLECLEKGWGMRLGARIFDLRAEGYMIENIGADDGQYAVYRMIVAPPPMPPAFPERSKAQPQSLFA